MSMTCFISSVHPSLPPSLPSPPSALFLSISPCFYRLLPFDSTRMPTKLPHNITHLPLPSSLPPSLPSLPSFPMSTLMTHPSPPSLPPSTYSASTTAMPRLPAPKAKARKGREGRREGGRKGRAARLAMTKEGVLFLLWTGAPY